MLKCGRMRRWVETSEVIGRKECGMFYGVRDDGKMIGLAVRVAGRYSREGYIYMGT